MFRYILLLSLALKINYGYVVPNFNGTILNKEVRSRLGSSVDWRESGHVSPVKDQGSCEACSVFAVVATIESLVSIRRGNKIVLSEQFLIDCLDRSTGCKPASIMDTYADIMKLGGVLAEKDYFPYEERQRECRWSRPDTFTSPQKGVMPAAMVTGMFTIIPDEDYLADFVLFYGPVTAAINPVRMKKYKGSYIDEPSVEECDPKDLQHTVAIVGFGVYKNEGQHVPYWIIKNSWGESFGDKGYYYLVRGRNACGIASDVMIPDVL